LALTLRRWGWKLSKTPLLWEEKCIFVIERFKFLRDGNFFYYALI